MVYLEKIAESAEVTSICAHGKAVGSLFKSVAEHLMKGKKWEKLKFKKNNQIHFKKFI